MGNNIITELELALKNKISQIDTLKKIKLQYEKSKLESSKICEKCKEWELLNLPYDCLSKPVYCAKKQIDFDIIFLYDEISKNLKKYN